MIVDEGKAPINIHLLEIVSEQSNCFSRIRVKHAIVQPRTQALSSGKESRSWSRATQILGGKLKKHLGMGGRVLRLENYNLCA